MVSPAFEHGEPGGVSRRPVRRALAGAKKLLVLFVMLLALLLSPLALPVNLIAKWVNRATGKTEQVTPRREER